MRRLFAVWLLLMIGLPFVSPLLASTTDSDAAVPLCCRRNGAHHCLLAMRHDAAMHGVEVSVIPPRCAEFPRAVAPVHSGSFLVTPASLTSCEFTALPSLVWQAEARARVALDRARRKRGPPAFHA